MTVTLPHEWAKIHAERDPDAPAVVFDASTLSYGSSTGEPMHMPGSCANAGIGEGDLVAIDAASVAETIVMLVGTHRSGAVAVPRGPDTDRHGRIDRSRRLRCGADLRNLREPPRSDLDGPERRCCGRRFTTTPRQRPTRSLAAHSCRCFMLEGCRFCGAASPAGGSIELHRRIRHGRGDCCAARRCGDDGEPRSDHAVSHSRT